MRANPRQTGKQPSEIRWWNIILSLEWRQTIPHVGIWANVGPQDKVQQTIPHGHVCRGNCTKSSAGMFCDDRASLNIVGSLGGHAGPGSKSHCLPANRSTHQSFTASETYPVQSRICLLEGRWAFLMQHTFKTHRAGRNERGSAKYCKRGFAHFQGIANNQTKCNKGASLWNKHASEKLTNRCFLHFWLWGWWGSLLVSLSTATGGGPSYSMIWNPCPKALSRK